MSEKKMSKEERIATYRAMRALWYMLHKFERPGVSKSKDEDMDVLRASWWTINYQKFRPSRFELDEMLSKGIYR